MRNEQSAKYLQSLCKVDRAAISHPHLFENFVISGIEVGVPSDMHYVFGGAYRLNLFDSV